MSSLMLARRTPPRVHARFLVGAALLLAALVAAPGPARAAGERVIAQETHLTEVDAGAGHAAWSRWDPAIEAYRLVIQRGDGRPALAPVAPRTVPFDVDLGRDGRGRAVAAYSRCRDARRERGCDLRLLDLTTFRERRLDGPSTPEVSETDPSVDGDRIAFTRDTRAGTRARRAGRLESILVAPLEGRGRGVRVPGGPTRAQAGDEPFRDAFGYVTDLELHGRRIAFGWELVISSPGPREAEIRLATVGGPSRAVARAGSGQRAALLLTPSLDDRHLTFGFTRYSAEQLGTPSSTRVGRFDLRTGRLSEALPPEALLGVSRDERTGRFVAATVQAFTPGAAQCQGYPPDGDELVPAPCAVVAFMPRFRRHDPSRRGSFKVGDRASSERRPLPF